MAKQLIMPRTTWMPQQRAPFSLTTRFPPPSTSPTRGTMTSSSLSPPPSAISNIPLVCSTIQQEKYSPSGCEKYIGHEVNLIQYGGDALAFKYKSQTLNVARLSVGAKSATTPSPNEKEFAAYHAVTVSDYDETTDEYLVPLAFIADDDFDLDFTRTTHLEFKFSSDIYCCVEEYQMLSSGEFATFDFEINDIRIVSTTDTNSLSSLSLSDNSSNNSSLSSPLFNFNSVLLVLFICFIFCLF